MTVSNADKRIIAESDRFDLLQAQRDEAAMLSTHVMKTGFIGSGPYFGGPSTPLFDNGNNILGFNSIKKGDYLEGSQYNALDGNDIVYLPTDFVEAAEAGYNKFASFHGGAGNDVILGGTLDDNIYGDSGDDKLVGATGNDKLYGGIGNDYIDGGKGNDKLDGSYGNDYIVGGAGEDEVHAGNGKDIVFGGDGGDYIYGGTENDVLNGDNGDDLLSGEDGNDLLDGGNGKDRLYGGDGNDTMYGGKGDDDLNGQPGDDILHGGDGNDHIIGSDFPGSNDGKDILFGEAGDDSLLTHNEGSIAHGGEGNDFVAGGMLFGDNGDDILSLRGGGTAYGDGGYGNDIFMCGSTRSVVTGGAGADSFIIDFWKGSETIEAAHVITDFEDGVDKIGLWVSDQEDEFGNPIGNNYADFDDVKIFNDGNNCIVADKSSGDILVVVQNAAGLISEADFFV